MTSPCALTPRRLVRGPPPPHRRRPRAGRVLIPPPAQAGCQARSHRLVRRGLPRRLVDVSRRLTSQPPRPAGRPDLLGPRIRYSSYQPVTPAHMLAAITYFVPALGPSIADAICLARLTLFPALARPDIIPDCGVPEWFPSLGTWTLGTDAWHDRA
jgi:hypothetical protein